LRMTGGEGGEWDWGLGFHGGDDGLEAERCAF